MKFMITEDQFGCTLEVDDETVLECMDKENLLNMTFAEVIHLVEVLEKGEC